MCRIVFIARVVVRVFIISLGVCSIVFLRNIMTVLRFRIIMIILWFIIRNASVPLFALGTYMFDIIVIRGAILLHCVRSVVVLSVIRLQSIALRIIHLIFISACVLQSVIILILQGYPWVSCNHCHHDNVYMFLHLSSVHHSLRYC